MLVDTDVMIDILRKYPPSLAWLSSLKHEEIGIPGFVAMELLQGCRNGTEQKQVEKLLRPYQFYWPNPVDCQRAFFDYSNYYLSHKLGIIDAIIAETAVGMDMKLATFNEKHYCVVNNLQIIQPYIRQSIG